MKKLLLALAAVATFVVGSVMADHGCNSCKRCPAPEKIVNRADKPNCVFWEKKCSAPCEKRVETVDISYTCPTGTQAEFSENKNEKEGAITTTTASKKVNHRGTRYNRGS